MDCAQITQVQRLEPAQSLLRNHAHVVAKGKSERFDTRIRCEPFFPDARNLPQKSVSCSSPHAGECIQRTRVRNVQADVAVKPFLSVMPKRRAQL